MVCRGVHGHVAENPNPARQFGGGGRLCAVVDRGLPVHADQCNQRGGRILLCASVRRLSHRRRSASGRQRQPLGSNRRLALPRVLAKEAGRVRRRLAASRRPRHRCALATSGGAGVRVRHCDVQGGAGDEQAPTRMQHLRLRPACGLVCVRIECAELHVDLARVRSPRRHRVRAGL